MGAGDEWEEDWGECIHLAELIKKSVMVLIYSLFRNILIVHFSYSSYIVQIPILSSSGQWQVIEEQSELEMGAGESTRPRMSSHGNSNYAGKQSNVGFRYCKCLNMITLSC